MLISRCQCYLVCFSKKKNHLPFGQHISVSILVYIWKCIILNKSIMYFITLWIFYYLLEMPNLKGAFVVVIVWSLGLQLPGQSVHITTKVVGSNPAHIARGTLDIILCDKVCQWFAAGRWFSPVLQFPPPIKLTATI